MKRGLLDITKRLFRQNKKLLLQKQIELDNTYSLYKLDGYKFSDVLREIENVDFKKSISISVNTQRIKNTDYIIESVDGGILVKFIKENINYELSELDKVEISGQFQKYA